MNRKQGKEKGPSQHHLSEYKHPASSPSFGEVHLISFPMLTKLVFTCIPQRKEAS